MEFQYYGGNCIKITTKNAVLVIDDTLKVLGLKSITKPDNVALLTTLPASQPVARLVITDPGEYEVSDISIFGIAARSHMDPAVAGGRVCAATAIPARFGENNSCSPSPD